MRGVGLSKQKRNKKFIGLFCVLSVIGTIPKNAFDEHWKPQPDGGVQYGMNAIEIELDLVFLWQSYAGLLPCPQLSLKSLGTHGIGDLWVSHKYLKFIFLHAIKVCKGVCPWNSQFMHLFIKFIVKQLYFTVILVLLQKLVTLTINNNLELSSL